MPRNRINATIVSIVWLLTACNGDIFIDRDAPLSSTTALEIEGNGGSVSVSYDSKGLEEISISGLLSYYTCYYDANGEEISSESSPSEISRIAFETIGVDIEMIKSDDTLTFEGIEYVWNDTTLNVILDYGYYERTLAVKVLGLDYFEGVSVSYTWVQGESDENARIVANVTESYNNESDDYWDITLSPYQGHMASCTFESSKVLAGKSVNAAVPIYINDTWKEGFNSVTMQLNEESEYWSNTIPLNYTVSLTLDPHTNNAVTTYVIYASLKVPYFLRFRNPVTGLEYVTYGTCTVYQPYDYKIEIEDANQ